MKDLFDLDPSRPNPRLEEAWIAVQQRLKIEAPAAWYERFIHPIRPLEFQNGVVTLGVPGKFVFEWVRDKYLSTIESMLADEFGYAVTVELRTEAREKPKMATIAPQKNSTVTGEASRFQPVEKFTFDSFVSGISNRLALAGARAVAAEPGQKYNPLFIYGPSGLGKTHLLHAIAREILNRDPKFPLVYISAQQFAEEFVNALQNNRIEQFRKSQRNVGVWLVDDIQFIAGKDRTQEEVFHTFNHLQSSGKQIVLTSDRPPRDLYLMDERMRSRFEAGLVADVQMPDTETRCAILLSKAEQEGIEISMEIAMTLAESVPGNIRTLEGALTKLAAQASVMNKSVDVALANEIVDRYYRGAALAKPGFDLIVGAVGKHFSISPDEIRGASRKAPVVHARHIAVFITREITGDSWKHIGGLFGDRDHSSIIHGYQKVSELIHADKDLKATVKMLMRNLYPEG